MDTNRLEQYIEQIMSKNNIAGAAVAVSQKGQVLYQKGFGYKNVQFKEEVTPDTLFGTASITKSFIAASIMNLQKEGLLSVHDHVADHIPELTISNGPLRIHHLLSHSTGLPPIERKEQLASLEEHIDYLNDLDIQWFGEPGAYFSYSNDAFILLGVIIERVTGKTYREYVTEQFLEKFNMNRSTFYHDEIQDFDNVSTPYSYVQKEYQIEKWPKLGNYAVGGGIRSTVIDLVKYGEAYIGQRKNDYEAMWQPIISVRPGEYYGYGLTTIPNYHGITLVRHGGGQPGVSSMFGFITEKDIVIAVLTNVGGAPVGEIWLATANAVLDIPIESTIDFGESQPVRSDEAESFIGEYTSGEGFNLEIRKEEDSIAAIIENKPYKLEQLDENTLIIKEQNFTLPYYKNEQGLVWAIRFGMRLLHRK